MKGAQINVREVLFKEKEQVVPYPCPSETLTKKSHVKHMEGKIFIAK